MAPEELQTLAEAAVYTGSGQHKDVPAFGLVPTPRRGAMRIEETESLDIDNPDCSLCPRKWVGRQDAATELLRTGISLGQVSSDARSGSLPARVWVRDQEDGIVYEAKRLSHPQNAYKAYPLTARQARSLPLTVI